MFSSNDQSVQKTWILTSREVDLHIVPANIVSKIIYKYYYYFFFFEREFQPMASAPDNSSLSSDQDTNQFLV